jgi:DNA adenine methylase
MKQIIENKNTTKNLFEPKHFDKIKTHSPFRWAGGKFYALKHILPIIPKHTTYVEPLCGGSRVFFAKNKTQKNWINDFDYELINCYKVIRDKPQELAESLKNEKASKERHSFYKNLFRPKNNFEKAIRWFYLNRTSYSGIMNMANCYWGYGDKYSLNPSGWGKRIFQCSNKLQDVKITNKDYETVIDSAPDDSFLFVDPPYFASDQTKFYTHSFDQKDHFNLLKVLKRNSKRLKFLLTYDNTKEIKQMYSWTKIEQMQWTYTISRTDDQKNKNNVKKGTRSQGQEIFIMNF